MTLVVSQGSNTFKADKCVSYPVSSAWGLSVYYYIYCTWFSFSFRELYNLDNSSAWSSG